jgi:hypothetical protein
MMHLEDHPMPVFTVAEHHEPHAALATQVERPPRGATVFGRVPGHRRQHVGIEPNRPGPMEAYPATEERVPSGRRLDGFPQAVFLEWTIDHTFEEEAHRVTGPVVDEHQLFEWRQRASGRGIGRFGGKGVSGRGVHGDFEDTFAIPKPRICRENATEASGTPPGQNC